MTAEDFRDIISEFLRRYSCVLNKTGEIENIKSRRVMPNCRIVIRHDIAQSGKHIFFPAEHRICATRETFSFLRDTNIAKKFIAANSFRGRAGDIFFIGERREAEDAPRSHRRIELRVLVSVKHKSLERDFL